MDWINKKTKERKFKAFLLIFACSFFALMVDKIDQDVFKGLAFFCGSFYAGSNVASKVVGLFDKDGR